MAVNVTSSSNPSNDPDKLPVMGSSESDLAASLIAEDGGSFDFTLKEFTSRLANISSAVECKALLQQQQAKLDADFIRGVETHLLIVARSNLIDALLKHLWQQADWGKQKICLIAVGGYGRGELHPQSDVDLLLLLEQKPTKANCETISGLVTYLWDCGLDLGHSVRTLKECLAYARDDITIHTNILESRPISGETGLFDQLKILTDTQNMWDSSEFFIAKWKEQRERHRDTNNNEYNLEPNIKTSPGGLRDIQNIIWIAKRHLGEGNIQQLEKSGFLTEIEAANFAEGLQFLWKARYALHMLAKRHEDRLLFDYQVKVAEIFGFVDDNANLAVEKFMHEYYRRVLLLAELNDVLIQHFDQDIVRVNEAEELIALNERFCVRNGYIDVIDEQVFVDNLWALIEIFVLMAEHNYIRGVRASTMRLMRTHRERIDDTFRNDEKVIGLFMQLLKSNRNVPLQLKRMRRHGILSKYLPAFGEIIGKMQYDLFHIYTVDIHTLEVVQNIYRFAHEGSEHDYVLAAKVINGHIKIELLYLAALFHDIAKGRGGSHSELGGIDAREFCQRHGVNGRDTNLIVWLVENHLVMSTISQKQDLSDPDVIRQFATSVGDRSRLDYLFILTVADINGTNPELWNAWRASLLRQLYAAATRALRRGLENPVDKKELIAEKQQAALSILAQVGIDAGDVYQQWKDRVDDYFLRESIEDLVLHAEGILAHMDSDTPLVIIKKPSDLFETAVTQITIYCRLRENRFSFITLALEQLNLSIHDARLLIAGGGHVLDTFYVLDADGEAIDHDSNRIDDIRNKMLQILNEPNERWDSCERRTSRRLKSFKWPAQTVFSNDYAPGFSVLEVIAPDRPGLLTTIGQVFFQHKLRVHNAKISTLGERVEDVFFLTDREDNVIDDPVLIEEIQQDLKDQLDELGQQ